MASSDQAYSRTWVDELETWPRTPEGYCSCPYCTAVRAGALPIPDSQSLWARRMGRPDTGRL